MSETHTLELPDVDLVYDVHGPVPTADGRPLLFMIGQPMQADGFADLAAQFPDRTVVTYDPRGLGPQQRASRRQQRPAPRGAGGRPARAGRSTWVRARSTSSARAAAPSPG